MTLQQILYAITISEQGSFNKASEVLYIAQPSLTESMKELEKELQITIFNRSGRGVTLTGDGRDFISYARELYHQYENMMDKYGDNGKRKKKFAVSTQHYSFAVKSFVELVKKLDMDEYEFEVHETRTYDVIDNVRNQRSEIGVLYMNDYNSAVLNKILRDAGLKFTPLFDCSIYAYMSKSNPLANKKYVTMKDLDDYPCVAFSQGEHNSFYFAEEVMSTYEYKRLIRVSDRATILNMMVGLNGYTLCSGIICEDLNGTDYCAVKLKTKEKMTIGYIKRKGVSLSKMGKLYVEKLAEFEKDAYNEK